MKNCVLVSFFIIFSNYFCFTQSVVWKHFGIKEGLSEPTINACTQDKDGILWLGSQTGLIRFDGRSFVKIKSSLGEQPYITSLVTGKDGAVWAGSRDGVWKYIPSHHFLKKIASKDLHAHVIKICWNKDSSQLLVAGTGLWAIKADGKVNQINLSPNPFTIFNITSIGNEFIASTHDKIIRFDLKGNQKVLFESSKMINYAWHPSGKSLLIVSEDGLHQVEVYGLKKTKIDLNIQWELTSTDTYNAIYVDLNQNIWINTSDTLYQYASLQDRNPVKHYWIKENPFSLSRTLCIFMDSDRRIWANSEGKGISMLSSKMNFTHFHTFEEMDSRNIWTTRYMADKRIFYYGTEKGIQVLDLNQKSLKRKTIHNPQVKTRFIITNIQDFDAENFVVSTYGSGAWLLNKTTCKYKILSPDLPSKINAVYVKKNGCVWALSNTGLYVRMLKSDPFIASKTLGYAFMGSSETRNGDLYISENLGLYLLENNQSQFKKLILFSSNKQINSTVLCISAMQNGDVWIGTISNGLFLYNKVNKKIEKVILDPDPTSVYGMSMINKKELLLTTSNGIYLYDLVSKKAKCYNSNNLLPFNDFNQFGYFANAQMISLCGSGGILSAPPKIIRNLFDEKASISIQENFQIIHKLIVPAGEQSFSVNAGIGLKQTEHKPDFEYRIKGLDQKWHKMDASGNISYNYIPPGHYILEVKMHDPNHILPDQLKALPVQVIPLWWQTIWFQLTIYLFSLLALIFLIRYFSRLRLKWKIRRMEAEQKVNNERLRISRELHDNVGSQLSYLITGLEASEMMSQRGNSENLTKNLENLQESARESMQQLRDAIWALNKEEISAKILIERFSQWIYKMTEQHEIQIQIHSEVNTEIQLDSLKTLNIFRILQEAVQNILKHAKATEVNIHFKLADDFLVAEINDNGCGFENQESEGNGLKNMKTRAKEMGATIEISSEQSIGTTIFLKSLISKG